MRTRHFKDMNAHIETPQAEIVGFCRRWRIAELELFGSVLRDDFSPNSDVDVLVRFDSEARPSLLDMARMQDELSRIFGRQADLVERATVEASRNYIRRAAILQSAEAIYAA